MIQTAIAESFDIHGRIDGYSGTWRTFKPRGARGRATLQRAGDGDGATWAT